jgi:hypothetical protein
MNYEMISEEVSHCIQYDVSGELYSRVPTTIASSLCLVQAKLRTDKSILIKL